MAKEDENAELASKNWIGSMIDTARSYIQDAPPQEDVAKTPKESYSIRSDVEGYMAAKEGLGITPKEQTNNIPDMVKNEPYYANDARVGPDGEILTEIPSEQGPGLVQTPQEYKGVESNNLQLTKDRPSGLKELIQIAQLTVDEAGKFDGTPQLSNLTPEELEAMTPEQRTAARVEFVQAAQNFHVLMVDEAGKFDGTPQLSNLTTDELEAMKPEERTAARAEFVQAAQNFLVLAQNFEHPLDGKPALELTSEQIAELQGLQWQRDNSAITKDIPPGTIKEQMESARQDGELGVDDGRMYKEPVSGKGPITRETIVTREPTFENGKGLLIKGQREEGMVAAGVGSDGKPNASLTQDQVDQLTQATLANTLAKLDLSGVDLAGAKFPTNDMDTQSKGESLVASKATAAEIIEAQGAAR